ncbi:MAG: DUF1667 domain-containing protein [Bacillota bacterium]|nr:DUF1667 domain-containing protein [Bacillota bacterium]
MKEIKKLTCIICPVGCSLTAEIENDKVVKVSGNLCKRGEKYAMTECIAPMRTLTTTVKVQGSSPLSVRSAEPIPKEQLFSAMAVINSVVLSPGKPIEVGDVIIADILGTGVDIIATSSRLYNE